MEENKIKETIEDLERTIAGLNYEINHTESLIELPTIRNRIRVLQNALNIAREAQETIRGTSNPSKDIFIPKGNNKLELAFFMDKLKEETKEVINAYEKEIVKDYYTNGINNLLEEIVDVVQVAADILAKLELSPKTIEQAIEIHNSKLKSRGLELDENYPVLRFKMME
ncbi:MAG: hypothetical protein K0S61_734 [Anaerocolumna sp.]|jgi:NTP pyrophosphatase (non-canonical NTP hydrolase)|nr:hypothetical protein [Anaerocolumna sp.]